MKLNELKDNEGAKTKRKRVGRGIGSGYGKTSGRGQKGQKARSGVSLNGFEGGQMPIYRRLPKRGFNSRVKNDFVVVNLGRLQNAFDDKILDPKKTVDATALKEAGLVKAIKDGIRILGQGEIKTKADFAVAGASESAQSAIEKVGGSIKFVTLRGQEPTERERKPKKQDKEKSSRKEKKKAKRSKVNSKK